jgi:transmembrane sensor
VNASRAFAPHVAEQAVHWLVEMQEGPLGPRQLQAWQQWLGADGEHRRAWEHIQQVNQRLHGLSAPVVHATLSAPRLPGRRRALKALLLLAMVGAGGVAVRNPQVLAPLMADYRSPVGQRRRMQLDDGTLLHLNTGSAVDVRFDAHQRLIRLLEGEILLTGAADTRPLRVATAQGLLMPGKARVNVRQLGDSTRVATFDGSVEVRPTALQGYPLRLEAGRQTVFDARQWSPPVALDTNSGAWLEGMLVAAHMRLADFLSELGRYRRGQLNCDPQVANLLISGSYPLADTERILELLEIALPVKVRRFTRYWVTVEARV